MFYCALHMLLGNRGQNPACKLCRLHFLQLAVGCAIEDYLHFKNLEKIMTDMFPILLVEDNPDDVFLVQRAFKAAGLEHPLFCVSDGEQAIEYLDGVGKFADRHAFPLPRLVIADLKMPRVGGFELIKWIRGNAQTRLVPIIVLSSSSLAEDINRSYILGANAYMIKPADFRALDRLFRTIAEFWITGEKPHLNWTRNPPIPA